MPSAEFTKVAEDVKNLSQTPTNEELLELYALFKQATVGDVSTDRPGLFDPKGKAKWDAWESKKGLKMDEAETKYIEVANNLISKYK